MGATNSTPHYELPQFIGTDKPAWLVDFNGAMAKIDASIYQAQQSADAAQQTADAGDTNIQALSSSLQALQSSVASLTTVVSGNTGNINTITSLIGNGTPTTTDQTIIGAINELHAEIGGGTSLEAENVNYDNTDSGLTANNVQDAIDELAQGSGSGATVVSGTLTAGQTSVTLSDASILASSYIDVYTDGGVPYVSAVQSAGSVVLTFDAQSSDLAVSVVVRNFS